MGVTAILAALGRCCSRYLADGLQQILLDEAQDLTPISLSLLVELCSSPEGIFLAADAGQSLYSRGFSWQEINDRLCFKGRVAILKRKYRSTREIDRAANAFLQAAGAGDTECLALQCIHSGPEPVLWGYRSEEEQWQLTVRFIQ